MAKQQIIFTGSEKDIQECHRAMAAMGEDKSFRSSNDTNWARIQVADVLLNGPKDIRITHHISKYQLKVRRIAMCREAAIIGKKVSTQLYRQDGEKFLRVEKVADRPSLVFREGSVSESIRVAILKMLETNAPVTVPVAAHRPVRATQQRIHAIAKMMDLSIKTTMTPHAVVMSSFKTITKNAIVA